MTALRRLGRALASLPGLLIIGVARGWQQGPSRVLPPSCRFTPSCSQYAIEAVRRHGAIKGGLLALWRLLRCQPWGGHGHDPVPERTDQKGRCGCPIQDNDPPDA